MRRTILLLATIALALMVAGGVALAAPGAPTVVSTVPADEATGASTTANIKAKFSEAMKARSINTNTFYLVVSCGSECSAPDRIPATVRYNDDTKTAILDPTSPLLPTTKYTATVEGTGDGDMMAVKDRGGTPMASDYIWHFATSGGNPDPF